MGSTIILFVNILFIIYKTVPFNYGGNEYEKKVFS